jgi:hypothetical protein
LLLDSNLLLLAIIGRADVGPVGSFKRTAMFSNDDYEILGDLIARFPRLVTTPHVLSEVSNLLNNRGGHSQSSRQIWATFEAVAVALNILEERHVPVQEVSQDPLFARFGLTDTALALLSGQGMLLLSVDAALVESLQRRGHLAGNFNHVRSFRFK